MKKIISLALCLPVLCLALLSGCGSGNTQKGGSEIETGDLTVHEDISGTVRYAVNDQVADQTDELLEYFSVMYPNIEVEIEVYSGDLNNALTAWATANSLPDVVLSWDNLSYFALQGWVYPLDELLQADPDSAYILPAAMDGFSYEGKTYAVPAWLQFSALVVNLDLLEELNLQRPDYDWTIDEFTELAKKATTTTTSGINHTESLEQYLMEQMPSVSGQWGYDPAAQKFNLTDGAFTEAVGVVSGLAAYPGLVADNLRDTAVVSAGGQDDYAKKFGTKADGLAEGKILFANQSTWDDAWMSSQFTFNWDYYPIPAPSAEGSKQIVHTDYGMILSTVKDPQAAYELLKFFTFGTEGLLVRMEQQLSGGVLTSRFTIPPNTNPAVAEKFNAAVNVPDGVRYMYNHMDQSVKGDYSKVLPDYWAAANDAIYTAKDRIAKGEDPVAVAKEVENKLNSDFAVSYKTFSDRMKQIQAENG
ncbi:MAG: hypothetical protein LBL15_07550 [Oscillospiraceae bacterium]|jgi:ABC-type glycerol-3-phosphate transport system substrate-binding protein|nr:hypothetical protein [Oscillospiraceae bacterium]